MGRVYAVDFNELAVTAAQDLFEIKAPSSKVLRILQICVTQRTEIGDAQAEQLHFSVSRASGSYTSGSGGSAPTPRPLRAGDAAATFTAETGNTTRAAAGSGSLVRLLTRSEHVGSGLDLIFTPECVPEIGVSEALVVGLETAPADSITLAGYILVEELG